MARNAITDGKHVVDLDDIVTIKVKGIVRRGRVISVFCYDGFWSIELTNCGDRYGNYANWKQQFDGGEIVEVQ